MTMSVPQNEANKFTDEDRKYFQEPIPTPSPKPSPVNSETAASLKSSPISLPSQARYRPQSDIDLDGIPIITSTLLFSRNAKFKKAFIPPFIPFGFTHNDLSSLKGSGPKSNG